jgi:hypothetical protein
VAQGTDQVLAQGVEERMLESPEAARRFLATQIGPSAFRERLHTRP